MAAPSIAQIADALLFPNQFWSGSQISYSIPKAGSTWPGYTATDEQADPHYAVLSTDEAGYFRTVARFWDQIITPRFTETDDVTAPGQIRIAYTDVSVFTENEQSAAFAYAPPSGGATGSSWMGDIWLDYEFAGESFISRGGYDTMLHELGHALGLKHPFANGATLPAEFDNTRYTVMSYTQYSDSLFRLVEQGPAGPEVKTYLAATLTPMVFDIAALQQRYGADPTTRAGDDVYRPDISEDGVMFAYYDAGGVDELNLSLLTRGSIVDLHPGAYSSLAYWSAADQAAYWTALYPTLGNQIASDFASPGTYTWSNNMGLAYSTTIENFRGSAFGDTVTGNDVANTLRGEGGADRIFGALGDDSIEGGDGLDYLRGDEGADRLAGGGAFDDINGNMGNDTAFGGLGNDWVVGGKDNDLLSGDEGDDIVYGNIGVDWCDGGEGNDIVRGGQDNDTLFGQGGGDWMSGDRGDDTITGGTGADIFHSFGDAGIDRVTDFNRAEGDKVLLDPGTTYSVSQSGADVLVDMGGGGRMILVGVSLASLTGDWIAVG